MGIGSDTAADTGRGTGGDTHTGTGPDPGTHPRWLRRAFVVYGPRTAALAMALTAATACASSATQPVGSGSGLTSRSATATATITATATTTTTARASFPAFLKSSPSTSQGSAPQPGSALVSRLLDAQSAPGGYQVLPPSAFTVLTGSAVTAPACSSAALSNPYVALTTVRPVDVAERGIDGPDESSGFFWRGTEQLLGYHGDGAQRALTAVRQWVTQCSGIQPGGNTLSVSIGAGPKLGDESLTLHVSMGVQTSSGAATAPFDSIIVRTGAVVFVLSEQGTPAANGSADNAARLTTVANAAYARFQHS